MGNCFVDLKGLYFAHIYVDFVGVTKILYVKFDKFWQITRKGGLTQGQSARFACETSGVRFPQPPNSIIRMVAGSNPAGCSTHL